MLQDKLFGMVDWGCPKPQFEIEQPRENRYVGEGSSKPVLQ